ncbi:hypothetical protein E2C01_059352 [Portunus trituberculatus]|uniref:Uncharacterized protein n=1 Tax=Portunus trituberculatus TaxID=210409 RepID=A0A5B7GYW6_PORTR|nr:hypothetical protein [Portunus trituberculatus]
MKSFSWSLEKRSSWSIHRTRLTSSTGGLCRQAPGGQGGGATSPPASSRFITAIIYILTGCPNGSDLP